MVRPVDVWNVPHATARSTQYLGAPGLSTPNNVSMSRFPSELMLDREGGGAEERKFVRYGDLLQLRHSHTGRHLVVHPNIPSEAEPSCFTVNFRGMQSLNSGDMCFRILPKYKIRRQGDHIRLKDQVAALRMGIGSAARAVGAVRARRRCI